MATTTAEPSDAQSSLSSGIHPTTDKLKTLDETTPFVDYAVQQAKLYEKAFNDALDSALESSKSRLSQIHSTSSAHFHQVLGALHDLKADYNAYEELLFRKIKEGVDIAASHPIITCGATAALSFLVLKRPRQFMYYNALRLFVSEEALINRGNTQVRELRQLIESLKAESERLEKRALHAEEEFLRGRTKLRQAGKQIRSVIQSAYKIERKAGGLKDILGELPKREASHFRSQVSKLSSEAKKERNTLTKEVSKISNYGISV
ncbi:uncharacterized protein LOC114759598 [Neltuma alba]|uniref:uncharacterized protein LOC114759598 n=1 Tax=Neltuma alba TaxID=207710 RepID=UPI0010A39A74|nr:uncharacterized protein LOC114759598 [Prosopis alba]